MKGTGSRPSLVLTARPQLKPALVASALQAEMRRKFLRASAEEKCTKGVQAWQCALPAPKAVRDFGGVNDRIARVMPAHRIFRTSIRAM